jgi:hypothetical protein
LLVNNTHCPLPVIAMRFDVGVGSEAFRVRSDPSMRIVYNAVMRVVGLRARNVITSFVGTASTPLLQPLSESRVLIASVMARAVVVRLFMAQGF